MWFDRLTTTGTQPFSRPAGPLTLQSTAAQGNARAAVTRQGWSRHGLPGPEHESLAAGGALFEKPA